MWHTLTDSSPRPPLNCSLKCSKTVCLILHQSFWYMINILNLVSVRSKVSLWSNQWSAFICGKQSLCIKTYKQKLWNRCNDATQWGTRTTNTELYYRVESLSVCHSRRWKLPYSLAVMAQCDSVGKLSSQLLLQYHLPKHTFPVRVWKHF